MFAYVCVCISRNNVLGEEHGSVSRGVLVCGKPKKQVIFTTKFN